MDGDGGGGGDVTTGAVTVADAVPLTDPLLAVMVVCPAASAVNFPALSMVPTVTLLLDQVTTVDIGLPFWSLVAAVNVRVPFTTSEAVDGETVIVVSTGVGVGGSGVNANTVAVAVPLTVPLAALTTAVPAANAVNLPVLSTVPTVVLLLDHVNVTVIRLPF